MIQRQKADSGHTKGGGGERWRMHGKGAGAPGVTLNTSIILTTVMMWVSTYSYLLSCTYMFDTHY